LLQATRAVPIVFVQVAELGAGFVETLPQPGGNVTGFMLYEYGIGTKWLELLKEIAPGVKQVAFLQTSGNAELGPLAGGGGAPHQGRRCRRARPRHQGIRAFLKWRSNRDGRGWGRFIAARDLFELVFATEGGLLAYGPDRVDQFRRATGYVDRILRGEKPADLPVQAPTKYDLVINLKTAKALGLEVPPT